MATGWLVHELYMWHSTGSYAGVFPPGLTVEPGQHSESVATKRRFRNLLEVAGLEDQLTRLKARPASEAELCRFHTPDYVTFIKEISDKGGGDTGHLTPFGPGSYEIAKLAAGGTMAAVEAVLEGRVRNAYALVRPPGHHAERDRGMGFCLFGNVAVAVMHARAAHKVGRVVTVDWDVHHGNGTEQAFYEEGEVLTISLHQDRLFPTDRGSVKDNGKGKGEGANINIPLPPGSGVGAYLAAFERVVIPAIRTFKPELIVVPSGFDAGGNDSLGRMMMTSRGYAQLTRLLMQVADEVCGGRLVLSHEGGYSPDHVPYCGLAVMEELSGIRTGVEDPWLTIMEQWGQQELQPHQEAAVAEAAALVKRIR